MMRNVCHVCTVWAYCLISVSVLAATTEEPAVPRTDSLVREEFETSDTGSIGTSLGAARGAFVDVDPANAGAQIRRAAEQIREAAAMVADDSRASLHEAAHELDKLAKQVEEKSVESVHEVDQAFARTFHALAAHQIQLGHRLWQNREHRRAGRRLRVAADHLETAFKASGQRMNTAAAEAINESRMVSAKLVEGSGYAVDDVGRVFEGLGKQVEAFGARMEPPARRYPDRLVVPK